MLKDKYGEEYTVGCIFIYAISRNHGSGYPRLYRCTEIRTQKRPPSYGGDSSYPMAVPLRSEFELVNPMQRAVSDKARSFAYPDSGIILTQDKLAEWSDLIFTGDKYAQEA